MLRAAPVIAIGILLGPILFGIGATLLPAFGFFPALGGDETSLAPWRELLSQPGLVRSCLVSLASGLLTTLAAFVVVFGFVAGWSHSRLFRAMQHAISPLLSVPHAAAAFGLAFLFMPSGWLMRLISPEMSGFVRPPDWLIIHDPLGLAMMAGLFAKELPFLLLVTLAAMPQARPREHTMAAMNFGYGRVAAFAHGAWPVIYPQIRLAVFAVIAYSSSVVDVALILGPTNPPPLAVRLVTWMNDPDLAMRFMASAGAVLQLGVTAAALVLWMIGERIVGLVSRTLRDAGLRLTGDMLVRLAAAGLTMLAAFAVICGLFILALWSVAGYWPFPNAMPDSLTLGNWMELSSAIGRPLVITVSVGLTAMFLALILTLGYLERESRASRPGNNRALAVVYLPLIIPQVSFVFGLQLFFLAIGMDASYLGLVMVHVTFVFPYVLLSLGNPWRAWDPRFGQSALTLGASPARVFLQIRFPMLLRPVLVASAVGFAVSVSLYLPTLLIGAGRWPTVTTEAVALAAGGNRRVIGVYAFLQMVLPFMAFLVAAVIPALAFSNRRDMWART